MIIITLLLILVYRSVLIYPRGSFDDNIEVVLKELILE